MRIVSKIDIGDSVCCDGCNKEWRGIETTGGFLFGSYAYCPDCVPRMMRIIREVNEEHLIREHCPEGMSYHAWVMRLRDGNNTITVSTYD